MKIRFFLAWRLLVVLSAAFIVAHGPAFAQQEEDESEDRQSDGNGSTRELNRKIDVIFGSFGMKREYAVEKLQLFPTAREDASIVLAAMERVLEEENKRSSYLSEQAFMNIDVTARRFPEISPGAARIALKYIDHPKCGIKALGTIAAVAPHLWDSGTREWIAANIVRTAQKEGDEAGIDRRLAALWALRRFGKQPGVEAALRAAASSPDWRVRSQAAHSLERIDPNVDLSAVVKELSSKLADGEEFQDRVSALWLLQRIAATSDNSPQVRRDIRDAIESAAKDKEPMMRALGEDSLAKFKRGLSY